jgi:hypothetical protein
VTTLGAGNAFLGIIFAYSRWWMEKKPSQDATAAYLFICPEELLCITKAVIRSQNSSSNRVVQRFSPRVGQGRVRGSASSLLTRRLLLRSPSLFPAATGQVVSQPAHWAPRRLAIAVTITLTFRNSRPAALRRWAPGSRARRVGGGFR